MKYKYPLILMFQPISHHRPRLLLAEWLLLKKVIFFISEQPGKWAANTKVMGNRENGMSEVWLALVRRNNTGHMARFSEWLADSHYIRVLLDRNEISIKLCILYSLNVSGKVKQKNWKKSKKSSCHVILYYVWQGRVQVFIYRGDIWGQNAAWSLRTS